MPDCKYCQDEVCVNAVGLDLLQRRPPKIMESQYAEQKPVNCAMEREPSRLP